MKLGPPGPMATRHVNRQFAEEIIADLRRIADRTDHHAPGLSSLPDAGVHPGARPAGHPAAFRPYPLARSRLLALLPTKIRRQICEGMLGNDVIGFQTRDHARSFMYTCESYVPGRADRLQRPRDHLERPPHRGPRLSDLDRCRSGAAPGIWQGSTQPRALSCRTI